MRRRSANQEQESELSEVNIIPLANVCLTLVIIIMVVSPMVLQAMIQVQPSQAIAATKNMVAEKPLFVDVTNQGFTLNSELLGSEDELFRKLSRNLLRMDEKTVLISAAPDVPYQNVVRVLDIVRQSGAKSLSLVPRKEKV